MELVKRDNIFNQTSPINVKRNPFDLTNKVIGSWDMGKLYPVNAHEVYPNDNLRGSIQTKLIFNTLRYPIYQNLKATFYSFDVAYRILWKHWRNYYTGGRKGTFTSPEPKVNLNCASNVKHSLFDYLGFPLQSQLKGDVFVSAFPFVAYDFIYFWNFINPEIQENIVYNIQDKIITHNNDFGDYFEDELNLFRYYGGDFYLINEDGIPLYTRMLGARFPTEGAVTITYNSEYGLNDRYSYTGDKPVGIVCKDGDRYFDYQFSKNATPTTNTTGRIPNDIYRKAVNLGFLYNVNWQRDYFTSAHLSQQQGSPSSLPMNVDISASSDKSINLVNYGDVSQILSSVDGKVSDGQTSALFTGIPGVSGDEIAKSLKFTALASSFSPNDFRLFWQINMIKENVLFNKKNFEYGSYLKYFFGRSPNTSDLQQPVYIDSFDLDIYVGEILQTSQTTDNSSLGERGGIASTVDRDYFQDYTFDEIGLNMVLMFIAPSDVYQTSQGVNRQWLRNDRFDYYNPLLANIGLQEIKNSEIYAQGNEEDAKVFGYTPAFNELRYIPDTVVSDMRDSLSAWTLSRIYDSLPILNSDYLLCRPSKRIYNVTDVDTPCITGIINLIKICYRDMPELAIPELLDHRY